MNPRDEMLRQGRDFNRGVSRLRRWQVSVSNWPSYWGPDARLFYRPERKNQGGTKVKRQEEREIQWGSKVRKSSVLQNFSKGMSSVLQNFSKGMKTLLKGYIYSLLSPGGQGQIISPWAEQRDFSLWSGRGIGTSKQAIEYDYSK